MRKILITAICLFVSNTCFAISDTVDNVFYSIQRTVDTVSNIQQLGRNREQNYQTKTPTKSHPITIEKSVQTVPKTIENKEQTVLLPFFNDRLGLYGYQTNQGKMVIPPKFLDARPFSEGLGAVYDGKYWGYVNKWGEYEINPTFGGYKGDEEIIVHPFVNGTAAVYLGNGNANGFADIKEGQYALISKQGKVIKNYDCIYPAWYGYSDNKVGEYRVTIGDHDYIIDSQGNILSQEY